MDERNVFITRSLALWQSQQVAENRVCGKIYPACEANDDTYSVESFGVTASGSGVLSPPVADCKMAHRLSNMLPALRFRHWKFITEDKTFYVIFKFSSIFLF